MATNPDAVGDRLEALRARADEDFLDGIGVHQAGRHQLDLPEMGLRVSVTRARYPNRPDGADLYAVTLSRLALDHAPGEVEVTQVLHATFGGVAAAAAERSGGPLVRLFRVPASG
ncbi:MAG: hypothetical protein ACR2GX_04090 [Candidatus Dormibacteria bacterium]